MTGVIVMPTVPVAVRGPPVPVLPWSSVLTVSGRTLAQVLDWWEKSERRKRFKDILLREDGVAPDDVIMSPNQARDRGLTSTVAFPRGNIALEGSVIKAECKNSLRCLWDT